MSWPTRSGAPSGAVARAGAAGALLLLPKDAADEKSAILEIRAGTGGTRRPCSPATSAHVQRYADLKGWRFELLSLNESELGGIKEAVADVSGRGCSRV